MRSKLQPANVPACLLGKLGNLLEEFESYVRRQGLYTRRVQKQPGGHITHWWLYVRFEEQAPSRSLVQFGETCHAEVNPAPHLWLRAKEEFRSRALELLRGFIKEMVFLQAPCKTCIAAFDPHMI